MVYSELGNTSNIKKTTIKIEFYSDNNYKLFSIDGIIREGDNSAWFDCNIGIDGDILFQLLFGGYLKQLDDISEYTEEEFFQYSLCTPYVCVYEHRFSLELISAVQKQFKQEISNYSTNKANSQTTKLLTIEYYSAHEL